MLRYPLFIFLLVQPLAKARVWDTGLVRKMPRYNLANHEGYLDKLFRYTVHQPIDSMKLGWHYRRACHYSGAYGLGVCR